MATEDKKANDANLRQKRNARWRWPGFSNKTHRGWLRLSGAVVLLIAVACVLVVYSHDLQIAREQHLADLQTSTDQHEQTTLETYLDRMSDLLLHQKLLESKPGDEVRALARARTLAALRGLNPDRKRILLGFLYEARLINVNNVIVDLSFANLHDADLGGASLVGTVLSNAFLMGAYLGKADLSSANLDRVTVTNQQLTLAVSLQGAIMPDGSKHP